MTSDERRRDGETVAGDSDGYRSDSDADSDGYPRASESDSDGYQPGRDVTRDATDEEEEFDEALRPLIDQWKSMRDGWWNQAGYETYWDLVKEEEARWQRMGFRSI